VAVLVASISPLDLLTLPACGVGAVLGLAGLLVGAMKRRGVVWPVAGLVLSLAVGVTGLFWPAVLGLVPHGGAVNLPVNEQLTSVPIANRDGKAARPITDADWVNVSRNAVHKSDLRLVVMAVTVKPLEYTDARGKQMTTKEKYLLIELRLSNVAINHAIEYTSWGELSPADTDRAPQLRDNLGKTYALKPFEQGTEVAGHVPRTTIGPLKAVKDMLAFEPPASNIEFLRLELPCSAFGAADRFHLVIPKRLVVYP
jgi:hypothetical protein